MVKRLMIQIDEEKCDGCGLCVPNCAEGALKIIDGKARVVSESYCDGLGACIGHCPQGALTLREVETVVFDEEAAMKYVASQKISSSSGCPGSQAVVFESGDTSDSSHESIVPTESLQSRLKQWPIKMKLVAPQHPALRKASLLLLADCAAVAYPNLHEDFLKGKTVIQVCPKFEDYEFNLEKLTSILFINDIKDVTIVHMEVPCCSGLSRFTKEAITRSGKDIPSRTFIVGVKGEIKAVL